MRKTRRRKRLIMTEKIRNILRLIEKGLSLNSIATSLEVSRHTVQSYGRLFSEKQISYQQLQELSDKELLEHLGKNASTSRRKQSGVIDFSKVYQELQKKGVTEKLLYQEYLQEHPELYSYATFCRNLRRYKAKQQLSFRRVYVAGDKVLSDYSGLKVPITDRASGEVVEAEIFVSTLGASNYIFGEAVESQSQSNWIGSHVRLFNELGGVPKCIVFDNLKSAVNKSCRYAPEINKSFLEFSEHYNVELLPTRVAKPKDKSKAEQAVQAVQRWVIAPLREQVFYSVGQWNAAAKLKLAELNAKPMRDYDGASRQQLFESIDKPALKALPESSFKYSKWKEAKVSLDYHVQVDKHYYSVPYQYVYQQVWVKISEQLVEVYSNYKLVTSHLKSNKSWGFTTKPEHLPEEHLAVSSYSKETFLDWSRSVGTETEKFMLRMFESKPYPEIAYRVALGLKSLAKKFGTQRLEAACKISNPFFITDIRNIKTVLKSGYDNLPEQDKEKIIERLVHNNLRGSSYYTH